MTEPKAVSVEPSPNKANASRRQSSLMQWFRSTSDPNPAINSPATATHHPSSDDFLDEDMADAFSEAQKDLDTSLLSTTNAIPHTRPTARVRRTSEQTSSTEERFETPPTIPPRLRGGIVGLGIGANEDNFYHKKSELVPVTNKKRSYPEPTKPPLPRKTSRETRSQRDAYNVDHLTPTANPDNQKKQNQELDLKLFHTGNAAYAVPTPPPGDKPIFSVPRANRSFDNLTSVSSSMMSASNAWTTPNTSFSSDSMATSFSSSTGGTETTIRASADTSWDSLLARKSAMQFEADENEWDYIYQAQTIKPPKINSTISCPTQGAPSNAMSLHKPNKSTIDLIENDSGSTIARTGKSKEASMAPPPGPFKRIYPTQSLEEQVADRLDSHSPFGTVTLIKYPSDLY